VEEYLDKPSDNLTEKAKKIHENYIYDFVFDDGHIQNIYLIDKKNIARNKVQVIKQFEQKGTQINRYDVTILVNGLPLVHIELKRRGVAIREAFNQINRYKRESFWSDNGLFEYVQLFVISNGTHTKYYSNTTRSAHLKERAGKTSGKKTSNSFEFTSWWTDAKNMRIETEGETIKADVINVIPPMKAGQVAMTLGLADSSGFCPVERRTFASTLVPNVYVIGDASIADAMPKSGFSANTQAKVVARAIVEELALVDQQHPLAQGRDVTHVVAGEQHRGAGAAVVVGKEIPHPRLGIHIQPQGGFIEKQHCRLMQQRCQ
jgi:hypothetical protein